MSNRHRNVRVFMLPAPGQTTGVAFEDRHGDRHEAHVGPDGIWRDDRGGEYTWPLLLATHEPLRSIARTVGTATPGHDRPSTVERDHA